MKRYVGSVATVNKCATKGHTNNSRVLVATSGLTQRNNIRLHTFLRITEYNRELWRKCA